MERCSSNRCAYNRRGMNNGRPYMGNQMNNNMHDGRNNNCCSRNDNSRMCECRNDVNSRNSNACNSCAENRMNFRRENSCEKCSENSRNRDSERMNDFPVGMAYVPWQCWGEIYPLNTGLQRGTIFPELDKPFFKGRCCN